MKKLTPLLLVLTMMLVATFIGCSNSEPKTEEPKTEAAPAMTPTPPATPKDTLPPLDTTATSRPEPRKN